MTYRLFLLSIAFLLVSCTKEYSCEDCIPKGLPSVETTEITGITETDATFHGELLKTGGMLITDYGFCWATHPFPSIADQRLSKGQTDSLQSFQSKEDSFSPGQTYYVRAYAANDSGIVYGRELTFKTSTSTLNNCLVAYYPFNGNTNDESGNDNHGTATGGSLTSDRNSTPNKAFLFDGDDFVKVTNSVSLSSISNSFTIAAWVNNQDPEAYIICKSAYNGLDMQFRLYADNGYVHVANNGKAADLVGTLSTNTWKHVAVTSDGVTAKYYLNGILVNTATTHSVASAENHTTDLYIGADTHHITEFFRGKLDEIRIYCRVLSDGEVIQLYNL